MTLDKYYENANQNIIFKIINSNEKHNFQDYLLKNRNIRKQSENKVGQHDLIMGHSRYTQQTFLYSAIDNYNNLPKNLTLIKEKTLFKKWIKKYNLNKNIKLKEKEDNIKIYIRQEIDETNCENCWEEYEEDNNML